MTGGSCFSGFLRGILLERICNPLQLNIRIFNPNELLLTDLSLWALLTVISVLPLLGLLVAS